MSLPVFAFLPCDILSRRDRFAHTLSLSDSSSSFVEISPSGSSLTWTDSTLKAFFFLHFSGCSLLYDSFPPRLALSFWSLFRSARFIRPRFPLIYNQTFSPPHEQFLFAHLKGRPFLIRAPLPDCMSFCQPRRSDKEPPSPLLNALPKEPPWFEVSRHSFPFFLWCTSTRKPPRGPCKGPSPLLRSPPINLLLPTGMAIPLIRTFVIACSSVPCPLGPRHSPQPRTFPFFFFGDPSFRLQLLVCIAESTLLGMSWETVEYVA